ncbi:MAG TPA: hypothetical protein VL137_14505 [Polyangiaceae bacterium]|nr:hypothetical protein [Polyangiaceae bacterium]
MKSSPLNQVKQRFGDKAKLLSALEKLTTKELWLDRVSDAKALKNVANGKLLKLHDTLTQVKKDFGSRAKLIEAILKLQLRAKDGSYKTKLEAYPTPRLVDLHHSATRGAAKAKAAAPAADAKPKAKKRNLRSKKSQAKAR